MTRSGWLDDGPFIDTASNRLGQGGAVVLCASLKYDELALREAHRDQGLLRVARWPTAWHEYCYTECPRLVNEYCYTELDWRILLYETSGRIQCCELGGVSVLVEAALVLGGRDVADG